MKHLFTLFLFTSLFTFSQNDNTVYFFTKSLEIESYDLTKDPPTVTAPKIIAQKGWRFKIDHTVTNGHVITFLKWNDSNNPNNQKIYANITSTEIKTKNGETKTINNEELKYYFISALDFSDSAKEFIEEDPILSFVTGAITIPIKIRPSGDKVNDDGDKIRPFDFTGEVNIGLSIGARIRLDSKAKAFLIPSAGLNLTSISIDENSVKNNIITSKTNASSITPFIGLIGEYDSFQLALITGWDRLAGKTGENWIYQGKPWFGIGLGYNIFNTSKSTPKGND